MDSQEIKTMTGKQVIDFIESKRLQHEDFRITHILLLDVLGEDYLAFFHNEHSVIDGKFGKYSMTGAEIIEKTKKVMSLWGYENIQVLSYNYEENAVCYPDFQFSLYRPIRSFVYRGKCIEPTFGFQPRKNAPQSVEELRKDNTPFVALSFSED